MAVRPDAAALDGPGRAGAGPPGGGPAQHPLRNRHLPAPLHPGRRPPTTGRARPEAAGRDLRRRPGARGGVEAARLVAGRARGVRRRRSTSTATIGRPRPLPSMFCAAGARQNRSVACSRCLGRWPGAVVGARAPRCRRTEVPTRTTTCGPGAGELDRVVDERVERLVERGRHGAGRAPGRAVGRTAAGRPAGRERLPARPPGPARPASASTVTSWCWPRSARARASRLSSTCPRRSVSSSASRCRSRPSSSVRAAPRSSTRSRSAVSGLRSWWLAWATKARCRSSASATVVGHLVERGGEPAQLRRAVVGGDPGAEVAGRRCSCAAASSSATGRSIHRASARARR